MSQSQLDMQITNKLNEYLDGDVPSTVVLSDQFCVSDSKVSVKRDLTKSTGQVVSIPSIFRQLQNGITYIRVQPISHLDVGISHISVTCDALGLNNTICKNEDISIRNNNYDTRVYKYTNGYTISITPIHQVDDSLELTIMSTDNLGHKSLEYNYVASVSTNIVPTWLTPSSTVYGTNIQTLVNGISSTIEEVIWTVNNGISTRSVTTKEPNCLISVKEDVTSVTPSIVNNISIINTSGSEDAIACIRIDNSIISISPSGRLHKSHTQGSVKLSSSDKFPTNTTVLDMIKHSVYGGIVLAHRFNGLSDIYALYSVDIDGRIEHITDVATEYTPVRFNKHNVVIDGISYLGVCCTDGVVLWFDKNINLVRRDKFLSDHVDVDNRLIVPSVCMINSDIVVSYRYGYELYRQDAVGDYTRINSCTDVGQPWVAFGNKFSNILSDEDKLIYSTDNGVYISYDGITWKRQHSPVFTPTIPKGVIRLVSKEIVGDVTYYYGCITDSSPYPLGLVVTTDLLRYTYVPLELNCSSNIPISTITGRGVWLPSYKVFLYERHTPIMLSVRCKTNGKWSDISSKTINVIW